MDELLAIRGELVAINNRLELAELALHQFRERLANSGLAKIFNISK